MISIFAKRSFLNIDPGHDYDPSRKLKPGVGQLMRVSSMIRADQIAEIIGAKINPESGYENDICIYVKPNVAKGSDFKFEGKSIYLDIIDGHNLGQLLENHPEVNAIVCSQADFNTMANILPNKIYFIPQHHCNFERVKRNRQEIKRVGVIGTRGAFPHLPLGLREELAKRDIELVEFSRFFTRQDIIDFYMSIDIQIVWRPYKKLLSNPLKIVNAASFGIPTIALYEKAFDELANCYIPVTDLDHFLFMLDSMRDDLYPLYSARCLEKAEEYHIDRIAKLYQQLP